MKILYSVLIFALSFVLWGCGSDEQPPRNENLDMLKRVGKKPDYFFNSHLECQILTATQGSEIGTVFRLYGVDTNRPSIGFESEFFEPIALDPVGSGTGKDAFVAITNRYGQSYVLFDRATGIFSISNVEFLQTGEKNTFRGNCLPLTDL
jgi:hypothetical protein